MDSKKTNVAAIIRQEYEKMTPDERTAAREKLPQKPTAGVVATFYKRPRKQRN